MANNSLYEICRLCMAVLDRDAIDCSKQENSELRENIEMIYNVKIKSCDAFTTKICSRCSHIVVMSTMQYIRVMEAQTNIQTALRLRNDIDVSLKKSNSIAGKKRPRNEMQIGPNSKRARNHSTEDKNDENSDVRSEKFAKTKTRHTVNSRPKLSPKKSPAKSAKLAIVQMNNQLLSNEYYVPMMTTTTTTTTTTTPAVNSELFKIQQSYRKPMQMNNVSNINLNNNKYLLNRQLSSQSQSQSTHQHLTNNFRIQNEFSLKKKVINSFTATEIMKRIVMPSVDAYSCGGATNSLFNVANDLYKRSTSKCGKVKKSTIAELTRKMAQLRLSGLRGYNNDVWSRVW